MSEFNPSIVVLKNGTSLITTITTYPDNLMGLNRPFQIMYNVNGGMILVQYLPEIKSLDIYISAMDVLTSAIPDDKVTDTYNELLSSKPANETIH